VCREVYKKEIFKKFFKCDDVCEDSVGKNLNTQMKKEKVFRYVTGGLNVFDLLPHNKRNKRKLKKGF